MKISALSIVTGMLAALVAANCLAGSPASGSSGAPWYNPLQWQMPSVPWSSEQPRLRKKSQGIVTDMNESAKRGWTKTKNALDPTRMFVSDPKPSPPAKSEPGFWGTLFGSEQDKQDVRTVNDFLSQPHPR
jgi:hypothetical protein